MRALEFLGRAVAAPVVDAATCLVGGMILWLNGGQTVATGPIIGLGAFTAALAGLLCIRFLLIHAPASSRRTVDIHIERCVVSIDLIALAALTIAWFESNSYFIGWLATLGAVLLLLGNSFQLLVDVTTGRNWRPRASRRPLSVHRFASLEIHRLIIGAGALAALIVTAPVHGWQAALLNPLTFLIGTAMGLSIALGHAIRRAVNTSVAER